MADATDVWILPLLSVSLYPILSLQVDVQYITRICLG